MTPARVGFGQARRTGALPAAAAPVVAVRAEAVAGDEEDPVAGVPDTAAERVAERVAELVAEAGWAAGCGELAMATPVQANPRAAMADPVITAMIRRGARCPCLPRSALPGPAALGRIGSILTGSSGVPGSPGAKCSAVHERKERCGDC